MICSGYANLLFTYLKVSYGNLQKVVFQPITESLYVLGPWARQLSCCLIMVQHMKLSCHHYNVDWAIKKQITETYIWTNLNSILTTVENVFFPRSVVYRYMTWTNRYLFKLPVLLEIFAEFLRAIKIIFAPCSENFLFCFTEKKWLQMVEKREKNLYQDCNSKHKMSPVD